MFLKQQIILVNCFLLGFLVLPAIVTSKDNSCITPDRQDGLCIPVEKCKSIWNVLVNKDNLVHKEISDFLKRSQCGIKIGSHLVCCHVEDADIQEDVRFMETSLPEPSEVFRPPSFPRSENIKKHQNLRFLNRNSCGRYNPYKYDSNAANFPYIGDLFFHIKNVNGVKSVENKCIGTLITSNFAVIPAHCAVIPEHLSIAYIEFNQRRYYIEKVIAHPNYNNPLYSNDIALLQLAEQVRDQSVVPICLPIEEDQGNEEILSTSKKEGQSNFTNNNVEFINNTRCESYFGDENVLILNLGQYCAQIKTHEVRTLDSYSFDQSTLLGSIIQKYTPSNQFVFSGFTSTTIRTTQYVEEKPYIYTNIEYFLEWILDNIRVKKSSRRINNKPLKTMSQIRRIFDFDNCGPITSDRRIIGGNQTQLNEFPWMGLIKYRIGFNQFSFECGASLISKRFVLTAAHCITDLPRHYAVDAVRLGEYDLSKEIDCQIFDPTDFTNGRVCNPKPQDIPVDKLIPHPNYNNPKFANDIGLVRLMYEPEMSQMNIAPICLPFSNRDQAQESHRYIVTGWGQTEQRRKSDILLKVAVPYVPYDQCQRIHGRSIILSPGHSCYGGEGIKDSCKGDSGSPLQYPAVIKGKQRYVQYGLVAAGHDECGKIEGFPGIYTNISYYMNFIIKNIY